jgi:MjaI restriction endonuclease
MKSWLAQAFTNSYRSYLMGALMKRRCLCPMQLGYSRIAELADLYIVNQILIRYEDIFADAVGESKVFPKYTTQIINLANQNAQGTRPRVVGQMSDLIEEFPGRTFEEWAAWYTKKMPASVDDATDRIWSMLLKLRQAFNSIDKNLVRAWVSDLVLGKTYAGMKFQQSILRRLAVLKHMPYRSAKPDEEARGIDGYIGDRPISIKPITYKTKPGLGERIEATMIYYDKKKNGILVEFEAE